MVLTLNYASRSDADRQVNLLWRTLALFLDVLLLGPPIGLLCVVGSFGSEATHRHSDPAYFLAGGIAFCYAVVEAAWGITPGLLIIGARVMPATTDKSAKRRPLRWAIKYGPLFLFFCFAAVADCARDVGGDVSLAVAVPAVLPFMCAGVYSLFSFARHGLSGGQSLLYFDHLAATRLLFTRRARCETAAR